MILRWKLMVLCAALVLAGGCGDAPPKTPTKGTYGQMTNAPATHIGRKRPPQPLTFNPSALLTWVQTELSPATLLRTTNDYVAFFTELERQGLGAPSYAAFTTRNGPRAFRSGERLEPSEMEENWLMVWFAGARGWTNADSPCVVYLQRRPRRMALDTNGLHFYFTGAAGDIVLLPLYGSYRPPAQGAATESGGTFGGKKVQTWEWSKVLPREPLMRVRYWASALREFPIYCEETFSVDRSTDSVTIRQKFDYHSINDDWGTKHLKLNPVSPTLGAARKDRQFPVKFSRTVLDLEMPTPFGFYMAAEGDEPLDATFVVLQWINEGRQTALVSWLSSKPDTWANWSPAHNCIEQARRAYRAGDIDAYNYRCYSFVRLFTRHRLTGLTGQRPPERLIPSGGPTPFVVGIEREVGGPNPPLLLSLENSAGEWPHVLASNRWPLGQVRVYANRAPSRVERVVPNWNTESVLLFP